MNKTKIPWCDYDRGWLSAIIDGEGWLSLIKEKRPEAKAGCTYKPIMGLSNKNKAIIEKARVLLCANNKAWLHKDGVEMLALTSNKLRVILPEIKFIAKERQRLLLIEALEILSVKVGKGVPRSDKSIIRLEKIYQELHLINANSGGK